MAAKQIALATLESSPMTNVTQRSKKTGKYRSAQQAELQELQQIAANTMKPIRVQIQVSDSVSQPTEISVTHLPKKAPIMSMSKNIAESPVTSVTKPSRFARLRAYLSSAAAYAVEQGRTFGKSSATLAVAVSRAVVSRAKATLTAAVSMVVAAKQLVANVVGDSIVSGYNHVLGFVSDSVRYAHRMAGLYAMCLNGIVVTAFQSPKFRRYGMVTMVAAYLCLVGFSWASPVTMLAQIAVSYAELNGIISIAQVAAEAVAQSVEALRLPVTTVYVAASAVTA